MLMKRLNWLLRQSSVWCIKPQRVYYHSTLKKKHVYDQMVINEFCWILRYNTVIILFEVWRIHCRCHWSIIIGSAKSSNILTQGFQFSVQNRCASKTVCFLNFYIMNVCWTSRQIERKTWPFLQLLFIYKIMCIFLMKYSWWKWTKAV